MIKPEEQAILIPLLSDALSAEVYATGLIHEYTQLSKSSTDLDNRYIHDIELAMTYASAAANALTVKIKELARERDM